MAKVLKYIVWSILLSLDVAKSLKNCMANLTHIFLDVAKVLKYIVWPILLSLDVAKVLKYKRTGLIMPLREEADKTQDRKKGFKM